MSKREYYFRVEPFEIFDKAIVAEAKDGYLTYSYWRLIVCVMEKDELPFTTENWEDSSEYVNFNIVSMAPEAFKITYATRYSR